jgi:hypothetical protein
VILSDTERELLAQAEAWKAVAEEWRLIAQERQVDYALVLETSATVARLAAPDAPRPHGRERAPDQPLDDAILATLAKGPLSSSKVIQAVLDVADIVKALRRLVREGKVVKEGRSLYALPRVDTEAAEEREESIA